MDLHRFSEHYAVTAQILPEEVEHLAAAGFVTVICNRPDNEEPGQPTAKEIRKACEAAGLAFYHVPVHGMPLLQEMVEEQHRIVDESDGPVLAYCRSGQRSALIFQASA